MARELARDTEPADGAAEPAPTWLLRSRFAREFVCNNAVLRELLTCP